MVDEKTLQIIVEYEEEQYERQLLSRRLESWRAELNLLLSKEPPLGEPYRGSEIESLERSILDAEQKLKL